MRAIIVHPGERDSASLADVAEPAVRPGDVLVETIAVGICGTDREIVAGAYGEAPPGAGFLVLGHESLVRVVRAPDGASVAPGDLAAGIVRHPDPVPCPSCAAGEWDMCRNGRYTEHGIKGLDGFMSERWSSPPGFLVKLDPALGLAGVLVEPASVVAKAWEHIDRIGHRAPWSPARAAILGAGPIGLLAALMGRQRGLDVHVLDRVPDGPRPRAVRDLGASYHQNDVEGACTGAEVIIECTGVAELVVEAMRWTAPNGIACLTGLSSGNRTLAIDVSALDREMVLENDVVFGSVNANRRHYEAAAASLAAAPRAWREALITRRVGLDAWRTAFESRPDDVKTVIEFRTFAG